MTMPSKKPLDNGHLDKTWPTFTDALTAAIWASVQHGCFDPAPLWALAATYNRHDPRIDAIGDAASRLAGALDNGMQPKLAARNLKPGALTAKARRAARGRDQHVNRERRLGAFESSLNNGHRLVSGNPFLSDGGIPEDGSIVEPAPADAAMTMVALVERWAGCSLRVDVRCQLVHAYGALQRLLVRAPRHGPTPAPRLAWLRGEGGGDGHVRPLPRMLHDDYQIAEDVAHRLARIVLGTDNRDAGVRGASGAACAAITGRVPTRAVVRAWALELAHLRGEDGTQRQATGRAVDQRYDSMTGGDVSPADPHDGEFGVAM